MDWSQFLTQAIQYLTGGLVNTASAIGTGLSAYVNGLLVDASGSTPVMSAFASVIFIFGGISLAFTLGRWVMNFVSSLGNRNR